MSTFGDYLQSKGLSRETVKTYNFYLLHFISWLDGQTLNPEEVTTGDVMAYLSQLKQKELSGVSRNGHLIAIRHYFDWLQQRAIREDNPAGLIKLKGVKTRKLYPIFSKEELEAIYHQYDAERPPNGLPHTHRTQQLSRQRNKAMLGLIIYQGLLTTEVNALTLKDLKLKEGTVFIAGGRKSNERKLDLKPQQILDLMEYQMITRNELMKYATTERDLLFLPAAASGQTQATDNDGTNLWKRPTEELRLRQPKLVNMLHIRTSIITQWLKQYNLRQVQYMAGHRFVSTTEGYLINQMEDLQQDIDQFHPLG